MFNCNLKLASKSIMPVITRAKPGDQNFDLDIIKAKLLEIFDHEIDKQERLINAYK